MAAESGGDEESMQSDFSASLKHFIASLEPTLQGAGSLADAEEFLTHLEATDESFHRYEFVRQLRSRINTALLPVVADEVEKRALGGVDCHNAIPLIIEELLASQEYATLSHSILSSIKSTVNEMIQSFDESSKQQTWMGGYNEYCGKYLSVDAIEEESSLSSSGKMSYMFMPHEKLRSIVQKLDLSQPVELSTDYSTLRSIKTRHQALMMLSQIPPSDVVTSEHWSSLKKCLSLALGDENDRISNMSLKLLSKIHIINNGHATREVFTCLTNHLMDIFQDNHHAQAQLDDGLNLTKKDNQKIVKKFRLLFEFLHEIPSYWVRYPERFVKDILESSISLLSLGNNHFGLSSFNAIISPLHYLAILDPKASWFKKWMHGYYSRKYVVEQLKRHPNLLIDTIQHCLEFASISKSLLPFDALEDDDAEDMQFETNSESKDYYSFQQLDYIYFVHSLCLLGRLLLYKDSRELFPVALPNTDDAVSTTDLVVAFIEIMSANYPNFKDSYHPGELVVTVLKEIASSTVAGQELLCKFKGTKYQSYTALNQFPKQGYILKFKPAILCYQKIYKEPWLFRYM